MKSLVWIPVVIVVAALAAVPILRAITGAAHTRELLIAGAICLVSSEMALIPLLLTRRASQIAVSQAALVGTVVHMFMMLALGAAAYALQMVGQRNLFLFLLMGLYWVSLILIVIAMIKAVRHAPPEQRPGSATNGATTP